MATRGDAQSRILHDLETLEACFGHIRGPDRRRKIERRADQRLECGRKGFLGSAPSSTGRSFKNGQTTTSFSGCSFRVRGEAEVGVEDVAEDSWSLGEFEWSAAVDGDLRFEAGLMGVRRE